MVGENKDLLSEHIPLVCARVSIKKNYSVGQQGNVFLKCVKHRAVWSQHNKNLAAWIECPTVLQNYRNCHARRASKFSFFVNCQKYYHFLDVVTWTLVQPFKLPGDSQSTMCPRPLHTTKPQLHSECKPLNNTHTRWFVTGQHRTNFQ